MAGISKDTLSQKENLQLLNYKLDTLITTVEKGFNRLDNSYTDLNKRLSLIEIWQPRIEGDISRVNQSVGNLSDMISNDVSPINGQLMKIIVGVVATLGTALTVILQVTK